MREDELDAAVGGSVDCLAVQFLLYHMNPAYVQCCLRDDLKLLMPLGIVGLPEVGIYTSEVGGLLSWTGSCTIMFDSGCPKMSPRINSAQAKPSCHKARRRKGSEI